MRFALYARLALLAACTLFAAAACSAQINQLNDLSARIEKELKPLKPHLVAVVDFRPPYGSELPQAHYFAWLLSVTLQDHGKGKFTVADHPAFDADLSRLHITADSLASVDSLRAAAPQIGADVLITGSIEKRGNSYFLQVTPVRLDNSRSGAPVSMTIESNEFFESMLTPFPTDIPKLSGHAKNGFGMPSCVYCPDPSYTDPARRAKINGTAILDVLISPDGQASQIRPVKMLGYGLDQQAYDVIKKWRFKPAKLDGSPVAVIVPVEVTFRLY